MDNKEALYGGNKISSSRGEYVFYSLYV